MNGEFSAQKSEESCPMSHSSREPTFSDGFYISSSITTVLHPYSKYQEAEFQCHEQDLQSTLWKWKWVFFLINYFLNVDFMYFMVTISTFYLDLLLQSILNLTQNETTGYSLLHSVSLVICAYFLFSCFIAYAILTFRYCRIKHQCGHQQKQRDWSHIHIPHIKFHTPTLNWSRIHNSQSLEKSMRKTHENSFAMTSSILLLVRGSFFWDAPILILDE